MDARWIQGKIEEYSFLKLAKNVLPQTEFPIYSYPCVDKALQQGMERIRVDMIPRFHYVTKDEEKAILNGTWDDKMNYENSVLPYGFYFVDIPMGMLRHYFPEWFKNEVIDEMIKPYYIEKDGSMCFSKQILTTAVFCILHEYGHYLDYKRLGKRKAALWAYESKTKFRENDFVLCEMKKNGTLTEELCKKREKLYRECADEYSADMYALSKLEEKVNEAFEYINQEVVD